MRDNKMPKLKPEEQEYISANHHNTAVPVMAAHLKRGAATIYAYMKEKDLPVYREPRERWHGRHPFKVMNRKLEAVIQKRNAENRGKPYKGRHYD